ncbi:hypothetical protein [Caballeronia sp. LZ035]|uniref:hypothetical protein n=1 Tax=Caballeronia sp. LZ035 TaxID=3038568 RepID=UPI002861A8FF|nr:hypothetical protein [Caballeronia sp. LZ035]MDR5756351.1 hypothetical protein [Caballeronia sp. LZ035]
MHDIYEFSARAWQIHDVLQTLFSALPEDQEDSAVPVFGVVGLLTSLSRELANELSEIKVEEPISHEDRTQYSSFGGV